MSYAPRIDKIDRNYVINGNMDYWQRGTSITTTGYIADRMYCVASSATSVTYSRSTDVPAGVGATYSLSLAGINAVFPRVEHRIESVYAARLATKAITIQFKVKVVDSTGLPVQVITSYPNAVDNYATSTTISTTDVVSTPIVGSWVTYRVNVTAPPQVTNGLRVAITRPSVSGANTTTLISQLMVIEGTFNTDVEYAYANRNVIEELSLCKRYYYNHNSGNIGMSKYGADASNVSSGKTIFFPVEMRVTPTFVPGTLSQGSGLSSTWASNKSITILSTATITNAMPYIDSYRADAEIN